MLLKLITLLGGQYGQEIKKIELTNKEHFEYLFSFCQLDFKCKSYPFG